MADIQFLLKKSQNRVRAVGKGSWKGQLERAVGKGNWKGQLKKKREVGRSVRHEIGKDENRKFGLKLVSFD